MISGLIHLVWKVFVNAIIVLVCISLIFIGYKANQPMTVAGAPKGMTYVQFIQDRLEATRTVQPARCGWGLFIRWIMPGPPSIQTAFWRKLLPQTRIFLKALPGQAGMKSLVSGGIWWNDFSGPCWLKPI